MPGNIKHTAGANPQPNNFGRKVSAKKHKVMIAFESQFNRVDRATKSNLKTWEDRNRANQNTKLNY